MYRCHTPPGGYLEEHPKDHRLRTVVQVREGAGDYEYDSHTRTHTHTHTYDVVGHSHI